MTGKKNIVLIGMMGCGKSTCGALLAKRLGRKLVDTDAWIEAQEGRTVAELFAAEGEPFFRNREQAAAEMLSQQKDLVIACGGGLPLQRRAMEPLKRTGVVLFLHRDPGETYDGMDTAGRPLAQQGRAAFLERFAQREPVYRSWADAVITEFASPKATVAAILEVLKNEISCD